MKTYLGRQTAKRDYRLTDEELDHLAETDQVSTVLLQDPDGSTHLGYLKDDLAAYAAERDIKPEMFDHLRGNLLNLTEAGMKYGIVPTTVWRWVKQGLIEVQETRGRQKIIDEADVAYLAALAEAKNMRPGKGPLD